MFNSWSPGACVSQQWPISAGDHWGEEFGVMTLHLMCWGLKWPFIFITRLVTTGFRFLYVFCTMDWKCTILNVYGLFICFRNPDLAQHQHLNMIGLGHQTDCQTYGQSYTTSPRMRPQWRENWDTWGRKQKTGTTSSGQGRISPLARWRKGSEGWSLEAFISYH